MVRDLVGALEEADGGKPERCAPVESTTAPDRVDVVEENARLRAQLDALALDRALRKLEQLDPEQGRIVELRFFGGLTVEETALAILNTTAANMANATRLLTVDRGLDARDFALIAFGGAGPLHARSVAERLGMTSVIVPPHPGLCSAFGAAIAEARVDRVQTLFTQSDNVDVATLAEALPTELRGPLEAIAGKYKPKMQ